jgi:hypothetical protein
MFLQGKVRNEYNILVGDYEIKRPIRRPKYKWEENIKINVKRECPFTHLFKVFCAVKPVNIIACSVTCM